MQVFHRGCADLARVVAGAGDDALGEVVQQVQGGQQRGDELRQFGVGAGGEGSHLAAEDGEEQPAVGDHLAAHQVERLDAVGAFVDLCDAYVAHQLLLTPFADVAVAAEHLLAEHAALQAGIGEEGLGHRGQQGHQGFGLAAFFLVLGVLGQVELLPDIGGKGAAALGQRLHGEQHAAHVGVHDDRVGGLVPGHRAGRRAALQALAGVGDGALVGHLGAADALDADGQALVVHHGEHRRQALVDLAHQPTTGAVEVHHAGGRGLDPHLVLDGAAVHRVACAERAVVADQELRHQEQRDAARTGRRVGQLGQHQVDDVLGEVLLAAGDEDLRPADPV